MDGVYRTDSTSEKTHLRNIGPWPDDRLSPWVYYYKGPIRIFASPFEGWNTPYLGPLFLGKVSDAVILEALKSDLIRINYNFAQFTYPRKIAGSDCGKFRINGRVYLLSGSRSKAPKWS